MSVSKIIFAIVKLVTDKLKKLIDNKGEKVLWDRKKRSQVLNSNGGLVLG